MTPRPLLLKLGVLFVIGALAADIYSPLTAPFIASAAVFAIIIFIDMFRLLLLQAPQVNRVIDENIPVQVWVNVKLTVNNIYKKTLKCQLHDLYEEHIDSKDLPQNILLPPQGHGGLNYYLKASKRGDTLLKGVDCLIQSPWGLWERRKFLQCKTKLKVQPNYKNVLDFALLGDEQRVAQFGSRQQRRRGEGTEFHQLREYRNGDPMRKIDWKASSRIGKLISKEFQDEQDQQLIFMVDSGRRMRHKDHQVEHMDQTLNSMLLLGNVASQQGDSVGFLAFGNSNHWCPPQKRKAMVKHLLDHCYDLKSDLVLSDYLLTAQRLLELQKRRSLIIILTNTRDEDRGDLEKAVIILRKRHLVVVADLHETFLKDTLSSDIQNFNDAIDYLATDDYLIARKKMHQSLETLGAICIDATPEQLPVALINTYHQIKHSGRL